MDTNLAVASFIPSGQHTTRKSLIPEPDPTTPTGEASIPLETNYSARTIQILSTTPLPELSTNPTPIVKFPTSSSSPVPTPKGRLSTRAPSKTMPIVPPPTIPPTIVQTTTPIPTHPTPTKSPSTIPTTTTKRRVTTTKHRPT